MATVVHPGPELLRAAADRLEADPAAHQPMTTADAVIAVKAAIRVSLRPYLTIGTLLADDLAALAWDVVDARWARTGYLEHTSPAGWAPMLRTAADWYENFDAYFDRIGRDAGGAR